MVFACLLLSVFATIPPYENSATDILIYMVCTAHNSLLSLFLLDTN